MASLELFLQDRHVGTVAPDARDRTRVTLSIDRDYKQEILLSEAFAALAGRKPPVDAVSNFLGDTSPRATTASGWPPSATSTRTICSPY